MTIEVHQLLIRSQVGASGDDAELPRGELPAAELERLREQVLAECKAWLNERLQDMRER